MGRAKNVVLDGFDQALGSRRGWHAPAKGIFAPPGSQESREHASALKKLWDQGHYAPLWKALSSRPDLRKHPQALALLYYGISQWLPDVKDVGGDVNRFLKYFGLRNIYCKKIIAFQGLEMHILAGDVVAPVTSGKLVRVICGNKFDGEDASPIYRGSWHNNPDEQCEGCLAALEDHDQNFVGDELYETKDDNQFDSPFWQERFENILKEKMLEDLIYALEEQAGLTQDEAEEIVNTSVANAMGQILEEQMETKSYIMIGKLFSKDGGLLSQGINRKILNAKRTRPPLETLDGVLKTSDFRTLYERYTANPLEGKQLYLELYELVLQRVDELTNV